MVWWVAAEPTHSGLSHWPAIAFAAIALCGLYVMLAPLLSLWPWRDVKELVATPLEEWIVKRLEAAEALARQRQVRSEKWFFRAMEEWDRKNAWELMMEIAPDLTDAYRADSGNPEQVDGIAPPHSVVEEEAYFGRRLKWLKDTQRRLQRGGNVLPKPASKGASLADELGNFRERGLSLRREMEPARGYATAPIVRLNQIMPALLEQRVRGWASGVRLHLEKNAPRFLALFDDGPDLPPPSLFANFVATTEQAKLLAFLKRKLEALDEIIRDINRGA